jgi:protein SCO1
MRWIGKRLWFYVASALAFGAVLLYFERPLPGERKGAPQFPNVTLTTQDGAKVRLYDDLLRGKVVAVNTFFAGCSDVCPLSTAKMLELKRLLGDRVGKDIFFYSISIDPVHDTPESLKAYAERYNAGPGWLFLTGSEKDVALITRKLGLGNLASTDPRDNHSTTLMVGNEATGQWMKNSTVDNPSFVAASMQTFLGWKADVKTVNESKSGPFALTNGQYLYQNGCVVCHTIGDGDRVGPDLLAVHERRERAWLERFVRTPDQVLASGDPLALQLLAKHNGVRMPNLDLTQDEVVDILNYIEARSAQVRRQHLTEVSDVRR